MVCAEPAALCADQNAALRGCATRGVDSAGRVALRAALSAAVRGCVDVPGEAGCIDVLGKGPRAALCAALSAAERGCAAAGIAAGEALDLLRAARSAAERPGAAAPQVWAATDVPQPDCGPGPADICVVVVRGVTTGRGCTTAGVRTRRSNMIARRPHAPPGRASHDRSSPKFSKFSGSIQEKPATRIVIMQYRSNKTQLPTNENCAGGMPNARRTDCRQVLQ